MLKSDGRFLVSHCCDLALLFDGIGGIRVTVENSIGRIKQYARMTEPYSGTEDELNCEMNVVAGLVNLHLMKTLHRGSPKLRRRFLG